MKAKEVLLIASTVSFLALYSGPVRGYEILLDIDIDDDPTTLNTITYDTTAVVKIILQPSEPGESITEIFFGMGGTCWECEGVFDYGVAYDLHPPNFGDWTDHPDLSHVQRA